MNRNGNADGNGNAEGEVHTKGPRNRTDGDADNLTRPAFAEAD